MRKQIQSARSKASDTQDRRVAREAFQYVTTNPKKYGALSTRNERQLAKEMNSLHLQQNKRLAKLSSQIYEVKVHQWKLKEVDETSRDPRTTEDKSLGQTTDDIKDTPETELKHKGTVETRAPVGKNSRNEEALSLRRNRPMTSGDVSLNSAVSAKTRKLGGLNMKICGNSRILKHDRTNGYDLKQMNAEGKTIFEPLKQRISVVYGLKYVPVRRDANALRNYKYKSYNLMSENYPRERPKTPPEISKHAKEPRNGPGAAIDLRENLLVNKNHIGKINTRPELRQRSVQMTNRSDDSTGTYSYKIRAANLDDLPTIKNHTNKGGRIHYHESGAGINVDSEDSLEEMEENEERPTEAEEDWAETLKSCRYLRKPRGYETPEITIESIFQND